MIDYEEHRKVVNGLALQVEIERRQSRRLQEMADAMERSLEEQAARHAGELAALRNDVANAQTYSDWWEQKGAETLNRLAKGEWPNDLPVQWFKAVETVALNSGEKTSCDPAVFYAMLSAQ